MKFPCRLLWLLLFSYGTLFSQNWVHLTVTDSIGILPSLVLDEEDNPLIAFTNPSLTRARVSLATWIPGVQDFDIETAFLGGDQYVALALDNDGAPHITQHIHHFGGELIHHYKDGDAWINEVVSETGHDGWSCSPAFDSQNRIHVSEIDPQCCSGQGLGVEYKWFNGTNWVHEWVGTEPDVGPWTGTSLVLDPNDNPLIAYYDNVTMDLMLARKLAGNWIIETVDSSGDVGRYPAMQLDSTGEPVIAYYQATTDTSGIVNLARHSLSGWTFTGIGTLEHVVIAPSPGRISLAIDSNDDCHISYCDEKVLKYAVAGQTTVDVETILDFTQSESLMGWSTSLRLDSQEQPHIAYWTEIGGDRRSSYTYKAGPPSGTAFRINAGGLDFNSTGGELFLADKVYTNGSYGYVGGASQVVRKSVAGTEDDLLYQNYRDGSFSYLFDLPNGSYDVTCHLVEPRLTGAGQRVFDILAENVVVVDDYDAVSSTGGRLIAGTVSFSAVVSDGQLNVDFVQVSVKGMPVLCAIEVLSSEERLPAPVVSEIDHASLDQNYPNPFNPTTAMRYVVTTPGQVSLKIFDMLGREVDVLVEEILQPGSYVARWNGERRPSGTYIYRLTTASGTTTRKMILLK